MSKDLIVPDGMSIQLDYVNCLFPHQDPQGSISRPFVLPKENAKFFEFYNRVNKVKNKQPVTGISLYSKGIKIKEGLLKLNKFTEDGKFDCDFIFDAGAFYTQVKEKYLTDIPYTAELVNSNLLADWYTYMNGNKENIYPETDVCFFPFYTPNIEIKNEVVNVERLDTFKELYHACLIANYWDRETDSFAFPVNDIYGDPATFLGGERAFIPCFFTGKVVKEIFTYAGYTVKDNVFETDDALRRLTIFNMNMDREQPDLFGDDNMHISFKYDLPKVLITDFIEELRKRGIVFIIREDRKEVSIDLLKNILTGEYDKDWSEKTGRKKTISFNDTGVIKFTGPGSGNTYFDKTYDSVVNSCDYEINAHDEDDSIVVRDEKVIRKFIRAQYGDTVKSMNNEPYDSNNSYKRINNAGSNEINIPTISEIIENCEITDWHDDDAYLEYDEVYNRNYKKLMPNADALIRKYNNDFKEFPLAFLFYWGMVTMPIQMKEFELSEIPEETMNYYSYPFASNDNLQITTKTIYSGIPGIIIKRVYVIGAGVGPQQYNINVIIENTTSNNIYINLKILVGSDKINPVSYIYDAVYYINQEITPGETTLTTKWFTCVVGDGLKDMYVIIMDNVGDPILSFGEIFYLKKAQPLTIAATDLNIIRDGYRFCNRSKSTIAYLQANIIPEDMQILGSVENNANTNDLPYLKGPIPDMPNVSVSLDKWVPYFLQEYVDMMLNADSIRIERMLDLTLEDIKELTHKKKYINNPADAETGEYIIEEMSVAVSGEGISKARCTLVKVG